MTNLNSLLQEVKPLYKKRKTQKKTALKTAFVCLVLLAGIHFYLPVQDTSLNMLYTDLYDEEYFASLFEETDELTNEYSFFGIV